MDLFEAFRQLDKLYEDINSTEVSTWVALPEYLKNILLNSSLLTSDNTERNKNNKSGLYDPRGNHICFSTDHLNPANILQKFNFGLLFDRAGLEDYCNRNQAELGIKKVETSEASETLNWLARHTDFAKNLSIADAELSASKGGGIYVFELAETASGKKIIKFLNWEKPVLVHSNNAVEIELWDTLVNIFKTYSKEYGFWIVDENSSEEEKIQLGNTYKRLYAVKPTTLLPQVKRIDKYKYNNMQFNQECPRLYSKNEDSSIQVLAPNSNKALDTISNPEIKNHLVDNVTQEEEFRLYFNQGVQDFKFDPRLLKKVYIPSAYFISDKELHNIAHDFLDLELLYAMFCGNNNFAAHAPNPDKVFEYVYNNLDKFDISAEDRNTSFEKAKENFNYNYQYLKANTDISLQNLYWAIRLASFNFPIIKKLKDTKTALGLVYRINNITEQRDLLLEIFKILKEQYPQTKVEFYKRVISPGDISPHIELDLEANDRLQADDAHDPSRKIALIKNRSIHKDRLKNRELNLD